MKKADLVIFKNKTMNFYAFKRKSSPVIKPSTKIYKEQMIEGVSIPAIIHNGDHFFVDLDVYENGRVECWKFEDFEHFKNDVQRGWVAVSVPDDKDISINGLGRWTIEKGNWEFNKNTFVEYVQDIIKELNPKWENIYKYHEKKINGIVVGENGKGTIYKEDTKTQGRIFPQKINGTSVNMFFSVNDTFYLVKVNVFADDTLELSRLEDPVSLNIERFEKYIIDGFLTADIPAGCTVYIYGLGNFSVKKKIFASSTQDKLLEIKDIQRRLKGEPTTLEICRQAHQNYLGAPTKSNQEKLRIAYEDIPNHQRIYVGDMDTKDIEVRMIIYGEQEIENWSHYVLAKRRGEKTPTITFPKPSDG